MGGRTREGQEISEETNTRSIREGEPVCEKRVGSQIISMSPNQLVKSIKDLLSEKI